MFREDDEAGFEGAKAFTLLPPVQPAQEAAQSSKKPHQRRAYTLRNFFLGWCVQPAQQLGALLGCDPPLLAPIFCKDLPEISSQVVVAFLSFPLVTSLAERFYEQATV